LKECSILQSDLSHRVSNPWREAIEAEDIYLIIDTKYVSNPWREAIEAAFVSHK